MVSFEPDKIGEPVRQILDIRMIQTDFGRQFVGNIAQNRADGLQIL
jgi:hypothetical protein